MNFNFLIKEFNVFKINYINQGVGDSLYANLDSIFKTIKEGNLAKFQEIYNCFKFSLNLVNNEKQTLLHYALLEDQTEIATWLVNQGANANIVIDDKKTPIMLAVKLNRLPFIKSLQSSHIDPLESVKNENLLLYAFRKGNEEIFRHLIQKIPNLYIFASSGSSIDMTPLYALYKQTDPENSLLKFFKKIIRKIISLLKNISIKKA